MSSKNSEFKAENMRSWQNNADYWLHKPLRQVEDTKTFFKEKLRNLVAPEMSIVDMGCGSGWLLEFLLELHIPFSYIGLDYTKEFIDFLKIKYSQKPGVSFQLVDFEEPIPSMLVGRADIVFNCFNFFELLDLKAAFSNAVRMLSPRGQLVLFTIDAVYLALAVSKDMTDFRERLRLYEEIKARGETPHFFQNIDLGDAESANLKYASVLYSIDDFFMRAREHDMRLIDYGEVIKTAKFLPKVYQYMAFAK